VPGGGEYTITPELAGWVFRPGSRSVTLAGADATGQDFVAARTRTISGTVSGDVAAGVKVTLSGDAEGEDTTDGSGNYAFTDLLDGDYLVTPSLEGYLFTPAAAAVTLAGADGVADFVATTFTIAGTIRTSGGAPLQDVTVVLLGAATQEATTDASGAYVLTPVLDGSYMVIPVLAGFAFDPASRTFRIDGASVAGQDFTASAAP
jgi:hypothetical protein